MNTIDIKKLIKYLEEVTAMTNGPVPLDTENFRVMLSNIDWNSKIAVYNEIQDTRNKTIHNQMDEKAAPNIETNKMDYNKGIPSIIAPEDDTETDTSNWSKSRPLEDLVQPITENPFIVWATADYVHELLLNTSELAWFFRIEDKVWELTNPFAFSTTEDEYNKAHEVYPFWTYKENMPDLNHYVDFED